MRHVDRTSSYFGQVSFICAGSPPSFPPNVSVGGWLTGQLRPGWLMDKLPKGRFSAGMISVDYGTLFGHSDAPISSQEVRGGSKPQATPYDSGLDWRRYGWGVGGAFVRFQPSHSDLIRSNNDVEHSSDAGTAYYGVSRATLKAGYYGSSMVGVVEGLQANNTRYTQLACTQHATLGFRQYTPKATYVTPYGFTPNLLAYLSRFVELAGKTMWSVTDTSGTVVNKMFYSKAHFETFTSVGVGSTIWGCDVEYVFTNQANTYQGEFGSWSTYKVRWQVRGTIANGWRLLVGSTASFPRLVSVWSNTQYTLLEHMKMDGYPAGFEQYWPTESGSYGHADMGTNAYEFRTVAQTSLTFSKVKEARLKNRYGMTWEYSLKKFAQDHANDLRASALRACSDGLTRLDTFNAFESLPELPTFLRSATIPAHLLGEAKNVISGRLDRLPTLAKHLAEAYLAWIYGVSPTRKDVANLSSRWLNEVNASYGRVGFDRLQGRHFHVFTPGELSGSLVTPRGVKDFGEGTLILRSSSTMYLEKQSKVAQVLYDLGGLGIRPGLSPFWDTIPFSFIADWFTGIGTKLEDIDTVCYLLALRPSLYVHTYKLRYFPSPGEKQRMGIAIDSDVSFTRFWRETSRYVPPVRGGRFDFTAARTFNKFTELVALLLARRN